MALQKLSNAHLRVRDFERTVAFEQEVMGLTLIENAKGRALFAAGADDEVDLIVTDEGGRTGAAGFTLSVDTPDDLERQDRRLSEAGITGEWASDPLPGIARSLSFPMPSGHRCSLGVLATTGRYLHPGRGPRRRSQGWAPIDLDHITLRVDDVRRTMDFMREVVGLRSSDIVMKPDGGKPMATWMRVGECHHDVAMFAANPGETLDHLAWTAANVEDIKMLFDLLARHGMATEVGPGRHGVGGNIYGYFPTPGGNRYELSAEMPRVPNHLMEPGIWTDFPAAFSAWGAPPPESFRFGS